jgi:hypothetical protein
MAGVIKVEKFERDEMGGGVMVTLDVRTPSGQFSYPMRFPDQGSMSTNERQAFLELQKHLEEALEQAVVNLNRETIPESALF